MYQSSLFMITACIVSLASNIEPQQHLAKVKDWLSSFGQLTVSQIELSGDKAPSNAVPIYHNQVAYLAFKNPINYFDWVNLTKKFEQEQLRGNFTKPLVTLDIDIVAILPQRLSANLINGMVDDKDMPLLTLSNQWLGISRRFPLADYDKTGLQALAKQLDLSCLSSFI